jgi:hypothetical protein
VCITVDFVPVELSPTHCPHVDVNVSLKDFPPVSSETVLPLLPLTPSPVLFFHSSSSFCTGDGKTFPEKQKSSQIFLV